MKREFDFFVPLGYALEGNRHQPHLPKPEIHIFMLARDLCIESGGKLAFTNSSYFYPEWQTQENDLKLNLLQEVKTKLKPLIAPEGCKDSVSEAEAIGNLIIKEKPEFKNILVLCDYWHAPRAELIWKRKFPGKKITIAGGSSDWCFDKSHPAILMRTPLRWFLINFIFYYVMLFRLDFLIKNLHHPVNLKET